MSDLTDGNDSFLQALATGSSNPRPLYVEGGIDESDSHAVYRTGSATGGERGVANTANIDSINTNLSTDSPVKQTVATVSGAVNTVDLVESNHFLISPEELQQLCRWIPLRLNSEERGLLLLLEGALQISEYTDNVDVARSDYAWYGGRGMRGENRKLPELEEFARLVVALYASSDLKKAAEEVQELNHPFDFHDLLQRVFEIGRRYKIQNPTKMRTTYGKLMHILMDAVQPDVQRHTGGGSLYAPTQSILSLLLPFGEDATRAFLNDPDLLDATMPIADAPSITETLSNKIDCSSIGLRPEDLGSISTFRSRKRKSAALERIRSKHVNNNSIDGKKNRGVLPASVIERCLDSIGDALTFISVSTASVEAMIDLLLHFFDPHDDGNGARNRSLQLRHGVGGSRLSHSHTQQFKFVLQTLLLWKEIMRQMYRLWSLTDCDLVGTGGHYELRNTGQGMNRVQSAPNLSRAMSEILSKVQREVSMSLPSLQHIQANEPEPLSEEDSDDDDSFFGMRLFSSRRRPPRRRRGPGSGWVGLSVVHLGDRDVPNALFFIDKYQQVSRILNPIVQTVRKLAESRRDDSRLHSFAVQEYGTVAQAIRVILQSFFKHGFDGSGDDGGSCIDGRLTSSWNWCSKLHKKSFYPLFLLTEFVGFDGDFRR